ncbi:MAG: histidine--tRNA ligase [Patescibacteria group bacterium]|jgi:histidyl-tRNA synthetase
MNQPKVLQGFRDYLPADMQVRHNLIEKVRAVYQSFGFEPLDTPALEYAELLMGKYGEDEKLIYHFEDHGHRDVALRYDLTVPLARVMADHPDLPKPFKRYQIANVWRADSPQKGRFREFLQFDADTVGTLSPLADAEMVLMMGKVMDALDLQHYQIKVNHRGVLSAIFRALKISAADIKTVMRQMDKLDKIGSSETKKMLASIISAKQIETLFDLIDEVAETKSTSSIAQLIETDQDGLKELANFDEILSLIDQKNHLKIDLSVMRGLDYYTGIIYETVLTEGDSVGTVYAGGRYDKLMSNLANVDLPAVGASLGVDRLLAAIQKDRKVQSDLIFMPVFAGFERETFALAEKLRSTGLNVSLSLTSNKLGKQLQYANTIGAKLVLLFGEDEIKKSMIIVRNMQTGDQKEISISDIKETAINLKELLP